MTREDDLRAWARSADIEQRFAAADADDLPVAVMRELLHDPDPEGQVVMSLLANYAVPREVLDEARNLPLSSARMGQIANHPNAPFDLAEAQPLWKHTYLSITSYCEGKGLGEDVRDRIAEVWADLVPGQGGTLAEAVAAAR
ncbi:MULTISPECIES: hypothetical protein [unclassified Isoptericola]|uniref:hypothetical protein n=1 Tax=Isoptericola sp. NPDC057191 TaxID=3346041 RepID=UPI00363864EC